MEKKRVAILGAVGNNTPPEKQGAIEYLVYETTEELVKRGHLVTLFAPQTARTSAKLVPVCSQPMVNYSPEKDEESSRKMRIELSIIANIRAEILKRKEEIDIIFNHTVSAGLLSDIESLTGVPTYHIIHLPLFKEMAEVYEKNKARVITISENQKKGFPNLNYAKTIYNAVSTERFSFVERPDNYLFFAGKITEAKNPLAAIRAAIATDEELIIAGRVNDKKYMDQEIRPLLDQKRKYIGEVGAEEIISLYGRAKAFLFPTSWPEPFGLVMIEAMSCGTPVIAYDFGAVSEVIENEYNGFIVKNEGKMIEAIKKINNIKRENCRKSVEERFSVSRMADNYEELMI